MSEAYIGEIRLFGGNFTIDGWVPCDGRLLPIAQYDVLFSLIGTTYGGDGQETFAVPDLRSRIPVHMGQGPGLSNRTIGQAAGSETVTLTGLNIPAHTHDIAVSTQAGTAATPTGLSTLAQTASPVLYSPPSTSVVNLSPAAIGVAGASQPVDIMMPFLTLNFIMCAFGIYPPRN